jgi:hypothetical protein
MSTIVAHSHGPDGSDQRKRYQYLLLDQVWRDACSDPFTWGETVGRTDATLGLEAEYRNKDTGVVVRCEMSGSRHTFTLAEPVDTVPGRSSVPAKESEAL